jgi:uncharacterized membrane-anchored protein YjiN (DUF445 family)
MQRVSLSLLLLAAIIYTATVGLDQSGPWGFANTTAEAAMVGGLADWFAVTALFRHPLGIPIPHTAIIPRKKDDLANSLQEFFAENFLTEDIVRGRIAETHLGARFGTWLRDPAHAHRVVTEATRISRAALGRVSNDDVRAVATDSLVPRLVREPVAPTLGRLLEGVVTDGSHRGAVDLIVNVSGRWLLANPDRFNSIVGSKAPRWAPRLVSQRVATWSYQQAVEWLVEVRNEPDHPAREALDDLLLRVARDLQADSAVQRRTEALKEKLLQHPAVADAAVALWQGVRSSIDGAMDDEGSSLWTRAEAALGRLGRALATDAATQQRADAMIADAASWTVRQYGHELSTVISHTIQSWDGEQASRKIELHVGRDLQFIRINGTIVGALAGLLIHTASFLLVR